MTPTLAQVLDAAIRGQIAEIRVSLPGRIVSYDATKQRADVQPVVSDGFEQEDGSRGVMKLPTLTDVPVSFPGAGDYSQTFPIAKGDLVMLHFCSSSIARWKTQGGEVDPADDRRHQLADAVAYPGVRDFAHALAGVPSDAWVITVPAGKQIRLGSAGAVESAVKGDTYRSAEDTMLGLLQTALTEIATGLAAIPSANVSTTAAATAIGNFLAGASTYLASKVKVE